MPAHEEARALLEAQPDVAHACIFESASPAEVPQWLGAADLGLALIHATFSMQAVAAIKTGEYLLCGLPVLASKGVGDTEAVIEPGVGHCIGEPDDAALSAAADWFVDRVLPNRAEFAKRCRAVGLQHFSLDAAVDGYEAALRAAMAARGR
jgi:glycosyltransferase involved in cell wall biosynthesis